MGWTLAVFQGKDFPCRSFRGNSCFIEHYCCRTGWGELEVWSYKVWATVSGKHYYLVHFYFKHSFLFQTFIFILFLCMWISNQSLFIVRTDRSETKWRKADGWNMLKRINSPSSDASIFWCGHIQNWCLNVSWAQFAAFQSCLCVLSSAGLKVRRFSKYLNPMVHFANIHFYLKIYSFILFHWYSQGGRT